MVAGWRIIEECEAFEVIRGGAGDGPVVLTCEHASRDMPEPWGWGPEDQWLESTHWASDLGAAWLTRELAVELGSMGVLARFSRLLCDPNRREDAPDLFLAKAEGREVALNRGLGDAERERRIDAFYRPYHAAVDAALAQAPQADVFSIHSFTPVYEGQVREVELGVLFEADEALARQVHQHLATDSPYDVRLNEPYTGADGLMYSADVHSRRHGRRALELEVRQDLLEDPRVRADLVQRVARALRQVL